MSAAEWGVTLIVVAAIGRAGLRKWAGHQQRWRPSEWAAGVGLELTPHNLDFVRSYIRRTRTLRIAGGLTGLVAPFAYSAYAGEPPPAPFDFSPITALAGYLVGGVLAELLVRRAKPKLPTARLVPRDLRHYLPSFQIIGLRVTAAAALVLYLLYLVVAQDLAIDRADALPPPTVMVPMIVLILLVVELLQRYIVRRPQPAAQSDLLDADDAVRSASVHALAGAGIALELLIVSVEILGIGVVSDIQVVRWTLPWIAVLCLGVSLGSWMDLTQPRHWKVRHTQQPANP